MIEATFQMMEGGKQERAKPRNRRAEIVKTSSLILSKHPVNVVRANSRDQYFSQAVYYLDFTVDGFSYADYNANRYPEIYYLGENVPPLDRPLEIVVEGDVDIDRCTLNDHENRRFGPANDGPEVGFAGQWQAVVIYEQSHRPEIHSQSAEAVVLKITPQHRP